MLQPHWLYVYVSYSKHRSDETCSDAAEISSAQYWTQVNYFSELLCLHATRWTESGMAPLFFSKQASSGVGHALSGLHTVGVGLSPSMKHTHITSRKLSVYYRRVRLKSLICPQTVREGGKSSLYTIKEFPQLDIKPSCWSVLVELLHITCSD